MPRRNSQGGRQARERRTAEAPGARPDDVRASRLPGPARTRAEEAARARRGTDADPAAARHRAERAGRASPAFIRRRPLVPRFPVSPQVLARVEKTGPDGLAAAEIGRAHV